MANNKFSKALRHLKSTELDEKIKGLNESPTNSMGGVYALNQPGFRLSRELDPAKVFYPDVDGNFPAGIPGTPGEPNYIRPAGYWDEGPGTTAANPYDTLYTADWSYSVQEDNVRNTETLIDPDTGYVLSELPPDSRSFILGPLVDLYFHNHGGDNRTFVGYVQKDTREFVLLGRVNGRWGDDNNGDTINQDGFTSGRIWDGLESGFSASNSNFTFEMLQWFHNKLKAGLSVKNASFFNSGGVPVISGGGGTGQPTGSVQGNAAGAGSGDASNSNDANVGSGTGGTPDIGSPQDDPNHGGPGEAGLAGFGGPPEGPYPYLSPDDLSNLTDADKKRLKSYLSKMGLSYGDIASADAMSLGVDATAAVIGLGVAGLVALYNITTSAATELINAISTTNSGSDYDAPPGRVRNLGPGESLGGNYGKELTPQQQAEVEAAGNELRDARRALGNLPNDATQSEIDMAQERLDKANKNRTRVRNKNKTDNQNRKESYDSQFLKSKSNIKESYRGRRRKILREVKQPYVLPEVKKEKYKMNFSGKYKAQNTPDVTASKKSDDIVSAKNAAGQTWRTKDKYWSGYESTERMNIIYDHVGHGQLYWDTIVDENRNRKNMRDREIQEHLNLIDHNKAMKEIIEQQTLDAPKDPLFKKVASRLRTEIDYPDKPSKNGYPDTPPPEMVNGFHPEYGKRYKYDKLDPHSAEAMPATGNPEIDINVQKMTDVKKKAVKLKNILGKGGLTGAENSGIINKSAG